MYELFKDEQGLNLTPQFNKKITSLIYYAQENSISKIFNPELFEEPDLVRYKAHIKKTEFVGKNYQEKIIEEETNANLQRYHLKKPAGNN